jgi:hypothetical protein
VVAKRLPPSNGLVLMSFGSLADAGSMPRSMGRAYARAFADLPRLEFIVKTAANDPNRQLLRRHPNIHPMAWIEQKALLGMHENQLLFF